MDISDQYNYQRNTICIDRIIVDVFIVKNRINTFYYLWSMKVYSKINIEYII